MGGIWHVPLPPPNSRVTRLATQHVTKAYVQANLYDPDGAVTAGFLDRVLPPDQVLEGALSDAAVLAELPAANYAGNKLEIRAPYIETIKASLAD